MPCPRVRTLLAVSPQPILPYPVSSRFLYNCNEIEVREMYFYRRVSPTLYRSNVSLLRFIGFAWSSIFIHVVAIRIIRIVGNPASLLFYIEPGNRVVYDS